MRIGKVGFIQKGAKVIAACRRSGIQVFSWVNAFVRDLDRLRADRAHTMSEFETAYGPGYLRRIPDPYWIHLGGRALETFRSVLPSHDLDAVLWRSPANCARALMDTSHFHIDLYGAYVPGLCAGLAVAMEDLGRPPPAGKYPLLDILAASGIRGFYAMAREDYGYTPRREAYLNHCDLCTAIRRFLFRLAREFAELAPAGFYG